VKLTYFTLKTEGRQKNEMLNPLKITTAEISWKN
jgi:hypothetical protein